MADEEDDETSNLSPCAPLSPTPVQPWGRLMPCSELNTTYYLMPRSPGVDGNNDETAMRPQPPLDMKSVTRSDIFNVHWLGRNPACDVTATIKIPANKKTWNSSTSSSVQPSETDASSAAKNAKKKKVEAAMHSWAHSMISNRHCRIYCVLSEHSAPTIPSSQSSSAAAPIPVGGFEVYVENMSSNGTLINQTILLGKGEKRLLHSGDEICLVNPAVLRKKVKSNRILNLLTQNYSYNFLLGQHYRRREPSLPTMSGLSLYPVAAKRKQGCVNPRAMNYHNHGNHQSPHPACNRNDRNPHNSPSFRRIEAFYDMREVLGDGTSGQVRRAIHRQTGEAFAVKIIALRRNRQFVDSTQMEQEASILRSLDHPYIVKLVDVFVNPGIAMYLVMELLHGGDLFDRIMAKDHFTEVESRRVMRRLLAAVHHLHEQRNIVHRDLKPENILCVHRDNSIEVKLTDFGLAKAIDEDDGLKTFCGTPQYFAPEVLQRQNTVKGRGRYGKPADMWSLGVVLYVLISGTPPFSPMDEAPVVEFPQYPWESMPLAKDLVQKLLREDPKRRLSVRQACDHPWIAIEDGDTHSHPLDDPVLTGRKRLFASPALKEDQSTIESATPASPSANGVDEQDAMVESSSSPSSLSKDQGDNSSVLSKEDFAKSAVADTCCDEGHHRRNESLFVLPIMHSPELEERTPPPSIEQQSAQPSGDYMEVEVASTKTPKPSTDCTSTPSKQNSSSLGDNSTAPSAALNLSYLHEVTPSDALNGEPLSPRYPLTQLSLNQRCNQFREQVLSSSKVGSAAEVVPASSEKDETNLASDRSIAFSEDSGKETCQSSPRTEVKSREDHHGSCGLTPTASNRRRQIHILGSEGDLPMLDEVEDDISRFASSDASESLSSFGSSPANSPAASEKDKSVANASEESEPPQKRRLSMDNGDANVCSESEERPTKKAKRSTNKAPEQDSKPQKVVRQTKLTAWVVKKKIPKTDDAASATTSQPK